MDQENFVPVATYSSEVEAQLAQATLLAANIESFIKDDDVGGMIPSLEESNGVRLLVDRNDAEEAKTILSTTPTSTPDAEPTDL